MTDSQIEHVIGDAAPPAEHAGVVDLASVGEGLLRDARNQPAHRAARTVVASTTLRSTLIALLAGAELNEHQSPPSATLQTITGEVRLRTGEHELPVRVGELVRIPPQRHGLLAVSDAVVLLTVALH